LFSQSLEGFGAVCRQKKAPVLAVYDVGSLEEIKKYNSISLDAAGKITFFEEKPKNPTSTLTGIALYYYPKASLPLIHQYIAEGTIPISRGGWCNGFISGRRSIRGACREFGLTSAPRKAWKRPTDFFQNAGRVMQCE
jgi:hypothetical protein